MRPDDFWSYTMRELYLTCSAFQLHQHFEWERTRNVEFANYNVQYNFTTGKKVFKSIKKPSDLYELPTDVTINRKPIKIDKERQLRAVERHKKTYKL